MRARRHTRFRVRPSFPVKICLPRGSKTFELQTLGMGGFGFYASPKEARLVQEEVLDVQLILGPKKIEVSVKVPYCQFLPIGKHGSNFIGMEFGELDAKRQQLIQVLIEQGIEKGHLVPIS